MQQSAPAQPALGGRRALIGALILGAVAAGLIVAFLASQESGTKETNATAEPVTVFVATQDIAAGATITPKMLEQRELPRELVVAGAVTRSDDAVDKVARYPIARGEQVATARLVEAAASNSLSFQIPAGMRGFTVNVDVKKSPAALIAPGDFVDVIVSAELVRLSPGTDSATPVPDNNERPKAAVTLFQNVQVLSVQRNFVENGVVYNTSTRGAPPGKDDDVTYVMLAVRPDQAQLLWLASQGGEITLSLRPFGDDAVVDLAPVAEPIRLQPTR